MTGLDEELGRKENLWHLFNQSLQEQDETKKINIINDDSTSSFHNVQLAFI